MKPSIWVIAIAAALLLTLSGRSASAAQTASPDPSLVSDCFLDIPYADQSAAQRLDIYLPNRGERPYPVVLLIHGDAPQAADRRGRIAAYADPVLKKGCAVVSMDYRFSSEALFTARIHDAKAAVRYIKAVAGDYGLDPHRIIAWGESTGGTLAALLAVSGDVAALEDAGLGNADQSSRIHGAMIWSGVFDFIRSDGQSKRAPGDSEATEGPRSVADKSAAFLSPAAHITVDDPPFLIQHGTADTRVPVRQAVAFADELEQVLGSELVSLDLIEGAGHGDPAFFDPGNMEKVLDFLDTWTD